MKPNPLYDYWLKHSYNVPFGDESFDGKKWHAAFEARDYAIRQWAWAVPNAEAVAFIQDRPLVEICAGSGYWASLCNDVIAYDSHIQFWPNYYHEVKFGDEKEVVKHPERTLFLCWPPYQWNKFDDLLSLYVGDEIIYVGELDGCTAWSHKFDIEWSMTEKIAIPQWPGIHDHMMLFKRIKK